MRQTCFTFIVIIIVSAGFFFRGAPFAFAGGPQGSGVIVPDGSANCGGAGTLCEWAWNDVAGWVDFCVPVSGNCTLPVTVSDTELGGYASSSVGFISLNCASGPPGSNCTVSYKVSNDAHGNLAGWAWSDAIGWISFCGDKNGGSVSSGGTWACPSSPDLPTFYQVKIDQATGFFSGWAWNDVVGWISFSYVNTGSAILYRVKETGWTAQLPQDAVLTSSIFDTCPTGINCGVAINSIVWHGTEPGLPDPPGLYVSFKLATDCAAGQGTVPDCIGGAAGWNFTGPPSSTYYGPASPGVPIPVINQHNKRYFRYQVFLLPNSGRTQSPKIDDIIINWSP